jgi:hypothetical protein
MHPFRLSLMGVFVMLVVLGGLSSSRGASIVSPADDDSRAQLQRDTDDCRRRAIMHTGFDPKDPTPAEAPRKTTTRMKPMPGPEGRALQEAERRQDVRERKKQQVQDEADLESRRAAYDRAMKTCLEGLNHAAEEHGALPVKAGQPALSK